MAQLPIEKVVVVSNIRDTNDDEIEKLATSMAEVGQLEPIQVYRISDDENVYGVKHGHRRLKAASLLGWEEIDALLVDPPADPGVLRLHQAIHNEQRRNLTYLEKAKVFQEHKEIDNWTQAAIAEHYNVSPSYVSLALSALKAHPDLQKAIEQQEIDPMVAKPLFSLDPEDQARLLPTALRKTAREVEALVRTEKNRQLAGEEKVERTTEIVDEADPMEVVGLETLRSALEFLETAENIPIQHPKLKKEGRTTVNQLIRKAQAIKKSLV